ncbi:MAG: efflux RND transporter periplasmic adaptor subunit [Archangiaceae bacterium]|nr:efflux RND transporter periplasmic adaptor subunit [Archangiaceae bacterium]
MSHTVRIVAFVLLLATCGGQIVRAALARPVTEPAASDAKKAERVAASRVGGPDLKAPVPGTGADLIGGNGVVEPAQRETRVAAQVTAVVREVKVSEGQQVKAGDVLVRLDDTVEQATLQSAEADLAAEQASYARTLKGLRVEDRDAVQGEADAAKSRAELAASVLGRTEQLAKTGAVTADELDRARRAAQTEQASYQATNARLRAALAGSRSEDIGFQRARVTAAQARVNQARASLERLTVRAPLDGEVLQVKIREGELYSFQGSEPLVVMGDTRQLRVRMDVDERDIALVALGAPAYVTADAFGAEKFPGKVLEVGRRFGRKNVRTDDPVEKNDTKILEVVIALDSNQRLVPGQRVTSFVTAAKR